LFRLHRSVLLFLIVTIFLNILWMWQGGGLINPMTPLDNPPPGRLLVLCFLYGVFFFIVRDKIVYKKWIVATCLSAFAVLVYSTTAVFIVPALVAYVTIALGVWNWRFPPILRLSDYSYGVYLYGFPIQQLAGFIFPEYRFILFNFLVSLPLALLLGFLSWHVLESRVARQKRGIVAAVQSVCASGREMLAAPVLWRTPRRGAVASPDRPIVLAPIPPPQNPTQLTEQRPEKRPMGRFAE